MGLLRMRDIRKMSDEERKNNLKELRNELMHEKGVAAMGGAPPNPGKIKALRKNISRLLTYENESKK